jgi:hypothetical protein
LIVIHGCSPTYGLRDTLSLMLGFTLQPGGMRVAQRSIDCLIPDKVVYG